jgi:hypothetical protein
VTFKLYAWNDTNSVFDLKITKTVSSANDPFWLPAGYLATKFYFELSGTSAVRYVILGESLDQVSSGQ